MDLLASCLIDMNLAQNIFYGFFSVMFSSLAAHELDIVKKGKRVDWMNKEGSKKPNGLTEKVPTTMDLIVYLGILNLEDSDKYPNI